MVWKACERFGVLPPGVKENFDENLPLIQARLITYEQVREIESVGPLI